MQPPLSKTALFLLFALPLCVLCFAWLLEETPDLDPQGRRLSSVAVEEVSLDADGFGPLRLAGAWRLSSDDPGFGGISALAVEGGHLLALTDAGVLIHLPRPRGEEVKAAIRELPAGPGEPGFKRFRDSEALLRDPGGRGWWIAFENQHELWLFDPAFERPLRRIPLDSKGWGINSGIEAMTADEQTLLLLPEGGGSVVRFDGDAFSTVPLAGERRISDAARLPDGSILLLERSLGLRGFQSALAVLAEGRDGYRRAGRVPLALGPLDNAEALAVEALPGGVTRLWLMTDDNGQPPLRTLLVALDLPASEGGRWRQVDRKADQSISR